MDDACLKCDPLDCISKFERAGISNLRGRGSFDGCRTTVQSAIRWIGQHDTSIHLEKTSRLVDSQSMRFSPVMARGYHGAGSQDHGEFVVLHVLGPRERRRRRPSAAVRHRRPFKFQFNVEVKETDKVTLPRILGITIHGAWSINKSNTSRFSVNTERVLLCNNLETRTSRVACPPRSAEASACSCR